MEQADILLKELCETVECERCSSFYTDPEQSDCGHNYCHDCWRNNDLECLSCQKIVLQQNLRPNIVLQERAEHVKELFKAFQKVEKKEKEPITKQNSIKGVKKKTSMIEQDVFPNVPNVNKIYVNRRKKRRLSDDYDDLVSATHMNCSLILPGENVGASYKSSLDRSKNNRHDTSADVHTHVQNWLKSTDNQFSEDTQMIDMPDPTKSSSRAHEKSDISSSKATNIIKKPKDGNRVSQHDWDKIEILDSAVESVVGKENTVGKLASSSSLDHYEVKPRRSLRSKKVKPTIKKNKTNLKANVIVAEVETHIAKDNSMSPSKRDSKESEKDKGTKQTWNNVKKMKREFGKLKKPNVKKLNISIESCRKTESVIRQVRAEPECIKNIGTPITIEDDDTPAQFVPSTSTPTPHNDKDKQACEEILRLSKLDESPSEKISPSNNKNLSIISDPPLTRFSTPDPNFMKSHKLKALIDQYEEEGIKDDATNTGILVGKSGDRIFLSVKALQREFIDGNGDIQNNFSAVGSSEKVSQCNEKSVLIECPEERPEITECTAIEIPETMEEDLECVIPPITETREMSDFAVVESHPFVRIPFLKLSKLSERFPNKLKHVPFYYKGDCVDRKTNRAEDEVVIKIESNNVSTSIKVSAKPVSVNIVSASKAIQTEEVSPPNMVNKAIQCSSDICVEKKQSTLTVKNNGLIMKEGIHSAFKLPNTAPRVTGSVRTAERIENSPIANKAPTIGMTNSSEIHKNTDSADTVTASGLDKITASDERAISEHMDCLDEDIFNSGSVVAEGQNIATPTKQPSEVMFCTTRSQNRNRRLQNKNSGYLDPSLSNVRQASKRMGNLDESLEQVGKRIKLDEQKKVASRSAQPDDELVISFQSNKETSDHSQSLLKSPPKADSEPMNYDEIIGDVFASIDADMNEKGRNSAPKVDRNFQVKENDKNFTNMVTKRKPAKTSKSIKKFDNSEDLCGKGDLLCLKKTSLDKDSSKDAEDSSYSEAAINPNYRTFIENKICSENMFSVYEKTQGEDIAEPQSLQGSMDNLTGLTMQENLANLLTPQVCEELNQLTPSVAWQTPARAPTLLQLATPIQPQQDHDSDGSVVEETPQKERQSAQNTLIVKRLSTIRSGSSVNSHNQKTSTGDPELNSRDVQDKAHQKKHPLTEDDIQHIVDITSDLSEDNSHRKKKGRESITQIVDGMAADKMNSGTPLTINRFAEQVKYKSTPVQGIARKSLNFNRKPEFDDTIDLCHVSDNETTGNISTKSSFHVKGTLEKEFMEQAFEKTPQAPLRGRGTVAVRRKVTERRAQATNSQRMCVACSCLLPVQVKHVKMLAARKKWMYTDSYREDLTHLIVGVDEANTSQRSVKYMCALADGKWIVSYEWVKQCLKEDRCVDESPYEALDNTGASGPQLSRTADRKLFHGIIFYCMPPFSILSEEVLASILKAAGGHVVKNIEEVSVKNTSNVAILLAEPENTQEDRFIDIAVNNCVVPVNYEWVLNSLGAYTVLSVRSSLLCPDSLPHISALAWPDHMMETTSDDEFLSAQ